MIFKVKKGKTMNREKFIAICRKTLAEFWHLDCNDIDLMNFNFSATFYGFYQAIFVGDKNSRADYIATAVCRENPFNPFDEKPIEFSIYIGGKNSRADYIATATSGVDPFDDKSIEFHIYKQTDCFMS